MSDARPTAPAAWAIDLAPGQKTGLTLTNPVMPAAGCYGDGVAYGELLAEDMLGAVLLGPVTAHRRRGALPPRVVPFPDGVLLHTGLANAGLAGVRRALQRRQRAGRLGRPPIIVHVADVGAREVAAVCAGLRQLEGVAAIELGLPDAETPLHEGESDAAALWRTAEALVRAARQSVTRPLLVRLPLASASDLCAVAVDEGADALTVAAPPRGSLWHGPSGRFLRGRLYGRFLLPLALDAVRRVAERTAVPLIGCGGVASAADARALLAAGACAVQVDAALWRDPALLTRIAAELAAAGPA